MSDHQFYITRIKNVRKHPNADRLQIGECFGNSVIVSLDYTDNQLGVYFPTDLQLSERFCAVNDLVRRRDENGNWVGGYLDADKRNIRAIKLRGEKSDGIFMPLTCLADFTAISDLHEGESYDTLNGEQICCKYIPHTIAAAPRRTDKPHKIKENICPTFYEHVDTAQLAYHLDKFSSGDTVELTLKMHGTSGRTGYLPVIKHARSWIDKLFHREGRTYTEYDYVTGTRRVVMDTTHSGGYYEDNSFRLAMSNKFAGKLHKGEVVYYEIVGFQGQHGAPIMSSVQNSKIADPAFTKQYGKETVFAYGCDPCGSYDIERSGFYNSESIYTAPCCKIYVYRMTTVNEDGDEIDYSPDQIRYRCEQMGIDVVPVFERFIVPDCPMVDGNVCSAGEYVLRKVEQYFDGPDPIGQSHVREGVVARIVNHVGYDVYKHKNFSFKVLEGLAKDAALAPDIEEAQEVVE